jgi:hypothetical protein
MSGLSPGRRIYLTVIAFVVSTATIAGAANDDPPDQGDLSPPAVATGSARRPPALLPLYISFTALQLADVHTTLGALAAGDREGNPVFSGLQSPAAMLGVKTALAVGTIYAVERLRKKKPRTAVVLMIALNSAYAGVVAHNYGILAQHR